MKARLADELPIDEGWLYEVKFDGIRALAVKKGQDVQLFSRRPRDITGRFAEIAAAIRALQVHDAVLDGEIVALNRQGHSSFQLLQSSQGVKGPPICYYLFDLLNLEGKNLQGLNVVQRKEALQQLLANVSDPLRFSSTLEGNPQTIWKQIQKFGLEGLIAKRKNSAYESDRRSGSWLKIKTHREQEFVIGGYTVPRGSRAYFGSIVVGYYLRGKLIFASRIGTGFNTKQLKELFGQFQKLRTDSCPFTNLPAKGGEGGLSRAEMSRCVWLQPRLVAQVSFMEWTTDGGLRHPVFVALRDDKKPEQVVRES